MLGETLAAMNDSGVLLINGTGAPYPLYREDNRIVQIKIVGYLGCGWMPEERVYAGAGTN